MKGREMGTGTKIFLGIIIFLICATIVSLFELSKEDGVNEVSNTKDTTIVINYHTFTDTVIVYDTITYVQYEYVPTLERKLDEDCIEDNKLIKEILRKGEVFDYKGIRNPPNKSRIYVKYKNKSVVIVKRSGDCNMHEYMVLIFDHKESDINPESIFWSNFYAKRLSDENINYFDNWRIKIHGYLNN